MDLPLMEAVRFVSLAILLTIWLQFFEIRASQCRSRMRSWVTPGYPSILKLLGVTWNGPKSLRDNILFPISPSRRGRGGTTRQSDSNVYRLVTLRPAVTGNAQMGFA